MATTVSKTEMGQAPSDLQLPAGLRLTDVRATTAASLDIEVLDGRIDSINPIVREAQILSMDQSDRGWEEGRQRWKMLLHEPIPGVQSLRDVAQAGDGRPVLILDGNGQPLSSRITPSKGVDRLVSAKWFEDALRGLAELHARGIVHGDVRPRNISIKKIGDEERAILTGVESGPITWWTDGRILDDGARPYYWQPTDDTLFPDVIPTYVDRALNYDDDHSLDQYTHTLLWGTDVEDGFPIHRVGDAQSGVSNIPVGPVMESFL